MMLFHNIDIYYFMADGIAIWEILFKYQYLLYFRLMLLPFGFSFIGRCYNQWLVADVIPLRLMLLPIVYWFNDMADVIANCVWQMLLPLCFYIVLAPMMKKSGVFYSYKCGRVECNEEYIGESSRTFEERFKEHQKAPSLIFDHFNTTGHSTSVENFNIVGREDQNLKRAIKEALYIRVNNPSLNRNVGKYHLPHIWDEVLYNIPELKLK